MQKPILFICLLVLFEGIHSSFATDMTSPSKPIFESRSLQAYLKSAHLISQHDLDTSYRVLGTSEGRKFLSGHQGIYITGKNLTSSHWNIYRLGDKYQRVDRHQNVVGNAYLIRLVARANLMSSNDQHSSLQVISQQREIMPNDIAIPAVDSDFSQSISVQPIAAPLAVQARIAGSLDGYQLIAANHVVVINRGKQDGLVLGATFELLNQGVSIYGTQGNYHYKSMMNEYDEKFTTLPPVIIGQMVVICLYEHFSLALITNSLEPIRIHSLGVSPLINIP